MNWKSFIKIKGQEKWFVSTLALLVANILLWATLLTPSVAEPICRVTG